MLLTLEHNRWQNPWCLCQMKTEAILLMSGQNKSLVVAAGTKQKPCRQKSNPTNFLAISVSFRQKFVSSRQKFFSSLPCLVTLSLFWIFLKLLNLFLHGFMDFSWFLHGIDIGISQRCYMDLSLFSHGFVKVVTWIWFLCISRSLPNKTKACWSSCLELRRWMIVNTDMTVVLL